MGSNEKYLDELLKSVQKKENEIDLENILDSTDPEIISEAVSEMIPEVAMEAGEELKEEYEPAVDVKEEPEEEYEPAVEIEEEPEDEYEPAVEIEEEPESEEAEAFSNSLQEADEDENVTDINDLLDMALEFQSADGDLEAFLSGNMEIPVESEEENVTSRKEKKVKKEKKKFSFGKKKKKEDLEQESQETDTVESEEFVMPQEEENEFEIPMPEEIELGLGNELEQEAEPFWEQEGVESKEEQPEEKKSKVKDKNPGLFSKFINFLTEEDEEDEVMPTKQEGVETLGTTSEENKEVLAQLEKEDKKKKKKKDDSKAEESEEEEEKEEDKGKKKKKKVKEPKPVEPEEPSPRLSKKKVSATFFFCFTIMAAIVLCCMFIPQLFSVKEARSAFYAGDYETCYTELYGKKLNSSDEVMFKRSEMMLKINRKLEAHEQYLLMGEELRALDVLLQAVQNNPELQEAAAQYGLQQEAEEAYQKVLGILSEKYNLTVADANEINAYEEDAIYTLRVISIVEGTEFVLPEFIGGSETTQQEAVLEDILPAEEELLEEDFGIQEDGEEQQNTNEEGADEI